MLGVIVLYGLVYALLFMVWLRLLNRLIQRGPEAPPSAKPSDSTGSVLDTAVQRMAPDHDSIGSGKHVSMKEG